MLRAKKSALFEKIFAVYNANLLRRRFGSFRAAGTVVLNEPESALPTIVYCNHAGWFDGLVAFQLSRTGGLDSYVMMEERQLRDLWLFRGLGAFSVVRENPREAARSIAYAAQLLRDDAGRTLWIFPQGEIVPADRRPVSFYHGVSRIVERTGRSRLVPLAIRYEFGGNFKPDIYVRAGRPEAAEVGNGAEAKALTRVLEKRMTDELDRLKSDYLSGELDAYVNVL